jgi:RNA polymerase sigma-70 factor (ECF subfamily)
VTEHSARVYGALRRFGLDPQEADEVAQEVFLRAWRGLARFEERSQFSTWLYRIAFNEAQRRLARRPRATASQASRRRGRDRRATGCGRCGPQARTLDREFEQMLERALAELPADLRAAVVLRDLEGLSTEEAAAVAGVRQAAFKSRLHRGRMQLRALLEPYLRLEQAA